MRLRNKTDYENFKKFVLKDIPLTNFWDISRKIINELDIDSFVFNITFDDKYPILIIRLKKDLNMKEFISFLNITNYSYMDYIDEKLIMGFE